VTMAQISVQLVEVVVLTSFVEELEALEVVFTAVDVLRGVSVLLVLLVFSGLVLVEEALDDFDFVLEWVAEWVVLKLVLCDVDVLLEVDLEVDFDSDLEDDLLSLEVLLAVEDSDELFVLVVSGFEVDSVEELVLE